MLPTQMNESTHYHQSIMYFFIFTLLLCYLIQMVNAKVNEVKGVIGWLATTFDMNFINVTVGLSHSIIYHHGA